MESSWQRLNIFDGSFCVKAIVSIDALANRVDLGLVLVLVERRTDARCSGHETELAQHHRHEGAGKNTPTHRRVEFIRVKGEGI